MMKSPGTGAALSDEKLFHKFVDHHQVPQGFASSSPPGSLPWRYASRYETYGSWSRNGVTWAILAHRGGETKIQSASMNSRPFFPRNLVCHRRAFDVPSPACRVPRELFPGWARRAPGLAINEIKGSRLFGSSGWLRVHWRPASISLCGSGLSCPEPWIAANSINTRYPPSFTYDTPTRIKSSTEMNNFRDEP